MPHIDVSIEVGIGFLAGLLPDVEAAISKIDIDHTGIVQVL
jgi:hypothetical protein